MMRLKGKIQTVRSLTKTDKDRMFSLMTLHYDNVNYEKFLSDLVEKESVLVLYDQTGSIQGFTTFMIIESVFQHQKIFALYSGDTIVDRHFWGQLELFRVFGGLFKKLLLEQREPLYWFLLTKGTKTYSMLPLFFKEFYPSYASPTPPYEQGLKDHLASEKFGTYYLKDEGIVRVCPQADRLKESLAQLPENKRLKQHVIFFTEQNPGYLDGDELVCLARISQPNFTRTALRFVNL